MLGKLSLVIVALCFYSSGALADTAPASATPSASSAQKNQQVQPGSKKHSKKISKKHSRTCYMSAFGTLICRD